MVFILTAVTNHGEIFVPANFSKEHLREIKNSTTFLCVECKEEVILKNGMINIPHFAHKRNSECFYSFSEGETEDHLSGKLQLYHFFQRKKVQAQLEAFIPSIKQRPDILIKSEEKLFAIEFQCSQLDVGAINNRSIGYRKQSILPFWILRTPITELPTSEIGLMQLSPFRRQFFSTYPTYGKLIITYCPQTKHFHYISNTLHIKTNTFIVKTKKLSVDNQSWPFAMVKRISLEEFQTYLHIYQMKRFKHIENMYYYNKRGVQSIFLRVCYKWQVHPKQLPLFVGIPTSFAEAFHVHAVEWQIQFLDYLQGLQVPIEQAHKAHCNSFLQVRPIGAADSMGKLEAVEAYLRLLQQCIIESNSVIYRSKMNIPKMNRLLYDDFLAN